MSQPHPKRKVIVIVAAVLLAAAAARFLLFRSSGTLLLTGIVATDSVIVSPEIQGRLDQLLVREGDGVKAGQLLGTIHAAEWEEDLSYYENSERQAAAMVAQADADLKYQDGLTESQIRQAEANLAAVRAQVAAAESDLEKSRLNYTREEALHQSGAESAQAFDDARTGYASSRAQLDALRKQAVAAEAAVDVAKANRNQVAARRAALQGGNDVLAASGAQRAKAKTRLDYTEIRSPIDGIVDVRAARQGEVVSPGQPVVTLVNPDDLWVRIDVEESYIDRVHLGEKMTVRLPSGAERTGTVFYRAVDADYATQRDVSRTKRDIKTFEIRLRCDNRDRSLALGMTAYVSLPLNPR
jgi:HlyD family secretion protein